MQTEKNIKNLIDLLNQEIDKLKNNSLMKPEMKTRLIHDYMNDIAVLKWVIEE